MNDKTLQELKDHFDEKFDFIYKRIDERFEQLDERMTEKFGAYGQRLNDCRALSNEKLDAITEKIDKEHQRLDNQRDSIKCLDAHKNKDMGFQRAVSVMITVLTLVIAFLGVKEFIR